MSTGNDQSNTMKCLECGAESGHKAWCSLAPARGSDAGVESESCGECMYGRVPTWDGEGNETGDEPCQRCDGTGRVMITKPQPNVELKHAE